MIRYILFINLFLLLLTFNDVAALTEIKKITEPIVKGDADSIGCTVSFSLEIESDQTWIPSEFSISPLTNFTSSPSSVSFKFKNQNSLIFIFKYKVIPGNNTMTVNMTKPVEGSQFFDVNNIVCIRIEPEDFTLKAITTPTMVTNLSLLKNMAYVFPTINFKKESGNKGVICQSSDLNVLCFCSSFDMYNIQSFICTYSTNKYVSLDAKINTTLILQYLNYKIWFEIDNPFPWNVSSTPSIMNLVVYPSNPYQYKEDYRMKSLFNDLNIFHRIRFINNTNLFEIFPSGSNLYLSSKNGLTSEYISNSMYKLVTSNLEGRLKSSTVVSLFNHSTSFELQNFILDTYTTIDNTSSDIIFVTFYAKYPFINKYGMTPHSSYFHNQKVQTPFPYSSNSTDGYTYASTIPVSNNFYGNVIFGYDKGSFKPVTINGNGLTAFFRFKSVKFRTITPTTYMATLEIQTSYPLVFIQCGNIILRGSSLIEGNMYNGTYQGMFRILKGDPMTINIRVASSATQSIIQDEVYNFNLDIYKLPTDFPENIQLIDFSYFKFEKTIINYTNNETIYNTLYFNLTKYNPDFIPYILFEQRAVLDISEKSPFQYFGSYDHNLKMYFINFPISSWMIGQVNFKFGDLDDLIDQYFYSQLIFDYFNGSRDSFFEVINPNAEKMPPIIDRISTSQNSTHINWILTISDPINGFNRGVAKIVSLYDYVPHIINFNSSQRISGDMFNGDYQISLTFPPNISCRSQIFTLDFVQFFDDVNQYPYNSLFSIMGTPYESFINITHNCNDTPEYDLPELVSIDFNPTIEVGGFDRSFEISFTTFDSGSGISKRHNPIIQLNSENGDSNQFNSVLKWNNETHFNYTVNNKLPYGFGYRYIFVSVLGIVDNQNNYRSYSMIDLKNMLLPYNITRQFNYNLPVLESSSYITKFGGSLIIYGKSLFRPYSNIKVYIDYNDGKGQQIIEPTFLESIAIKLNEIKSFNSDSIFIQLELNGTKSNSLQIIPLPITMIPTQPTQSPTPSQPSNCPGTPQCNNHGTCLNNECVCQYPWAGPTCNSQIIIITPPSPQPEPTTGSNITTDKDTTITSVIDIKEIREIDELGNIVQRYSISQWNLTDLTSSSTNPTYLYQSQLNGTTTLINTTIIFFKSATNITFGNENLFMQQSSIKFTIELSKYNFKSQLNSLQIIMESTIKGSDSDSCSSKQIGSDSKDNVKWIKMNIDKTSLYGRFIDFGIIDNRINNITNKIITDSDQSDSAQFRSIKVGMTIPYYEESVYLDPDFSNLVDINENDLDLVCKSKKKLSSGAIAGIVVGCVVFLSITLEKKRIKKN